jgi:hypothetical protein
MRSRAPKWLPLSAFLKQHNEHLPPPPEPKAKVDSEDDNLSPEALHGRVLGLHGQVTMSDIKRHYRERMMEYHPDRVAALGPKLREVAEHETKQINAAYEFFTKKYAADKSA